MKIPQSPEEGCPEEIADKSLDAGEIPGIPRIAEAEFGSIVKLEQDSTAGAMKSVDTSEEKCEVKPPNNKENYNYVGDDSKGRRPVKDKEGNWYHIYLDGTRVYEENYAYVGYYSGGRAYVQDKEGNWYHIDLDGKRITEK